MTAVFAFGPASMAARMPAPPAPMMTMSNWWWWTGMSVGVFWGTGVFRSGGGAGGGSC